MTLDAVILAAGQGSRMRSNLPKVLHTVAGKSMLQHVIDTAESLSCEKVHIVIGHGAEQLRQAMPEANVNWVLQAEQKGTGHAVAQALPAIDDAAKVLVLYGDVPLISAATLENLLAADNDSLNILTVTLTDPSGYGRIIRDQADRVCAIVEQKDASADQLAVREVNTGILAVSAKHLNNWLPRLQANNAQGEYYLTDIVAMAVADGVSISVTKASDAMEVQGANNRRQLHDLERYYQGQQVDALMNAGVSFADAARVDIRGVLCAGEDVFIDVNCVFEGDVSLGDGVSVGPNCILRNCSIGAGSQIKANTMIEESQLSENCDVGPYARLRPGSVLAENAKVGNFVETKKANIGRGSKVNHLSYIGDAEIGEGVNVGAGTITCNYDGVNKSKTEIGDGSFIGSNTALVAPVIVGKGATVGAGSTITSNIADGELAVARAKQRNIAVWKRPTKK